MIPQFSVVIPIFNEEENIPELYRRITPVMENLTANEDNHNRSFEILLVNDGSTDHSWELIEELHKKDKRVKGIQFSRNFGHHIAITAGLDYAKGDYVILMDGDLQDQPEEIYKLYNKITEGYDLVYGIRMDRQDPLLKKMTSALFWWILRKSSNVNMPTGQTMLRILSRRLVNAMKEMKEHARFVHGMMAWAGFKTAQIEVKHKARYRGESKYNLARMFKLAFHAATSFSTVPLRLATYSGFFCSITSLFFGLFFIIQRLFYGVSVSGYSSTIVAIFFVGGIQLLVLGMFGEYLGRTYQEVQQRPLYIIQDSFL